uniref:FH2 domain-containing protein n=1 Tax=Chenopodium quinoa TaxID=63459 RepID=A0A803MI83_CHEQI
MWGAAVLAMDESVLDADKTGDNTEQGKCEQVTYFKKSLNTVNSACDEVRNSGKLKEIMQLILNLGNLLNSGTARGSAVGFKLDSLLILIDTRATNSRMTLMPYLCKAELQLLFTDTIEVLGRRNAGYKQDLL